MRSFITIILILIIGVPAVAQIKSIGKPFIRNYQRSEFQAGQQNWMIDQSTDGRMYFANNNGLLEFDGFYWTTYPLPNQTIPRSLHAASDGRIYAGGFNELGYFIPNEKGQLSYTSLMDLIPEDARDFGEVWRIHETPDGLIFQSYDQLMILKDSNASVIRAPGMFHFSYYINGQLLLVDRKKGLLRYTMGNFFPLIGTEQLKGVEIWGILPYGNRLLFATADKGVFLYNGNTLKEWKTPAAAFLKKNQIFSTLRLDANTLAFGTIQNGLLITNNDGVPLQHMNRLRGLQNNTILCMMQDSFGNLWLGTDNGIDYLEINSPLSILSDEYGLSAGYAAALHKGILYVGTNRGVLYKPWESFLSGQADQPFKLLEETRGQVWTLQIIDDHLFCGHNNGAFIIEGTRVKKIGNIPGCWKFLQIHQNSNKILSGTYSGLIVFKKTGKDWVFSHEIKGFSESSRAMELDSDGSIWMSHGFKGIFHIFLNDRLDSIRKVDFYNSAHGFISDYGIRVHELDGRILFTTIEDTYHFVPATGLFEPVENTPGLPPAKDIRVMNEDQDGNIWYIAGEDAGVLRLLEDGRFSEIRLPFQQLSGNFVGGFEFVYPIDNKNVLFGTGNGFFHYNPQRYKEYEQSFNIYLSRVSILKPDSVIFSGHSMVNDSLFPTLAFRKNSIYFDFSANNFENPARIEFSSFLEGFDKSWTNWETRNNRAFTNLKEGSYRFYVKARNIYGVKTRAATFSFVVKPPWIRTPWAYGIYALGFLIILFLVIFFVRKRIERSQKLEEKKQKEKFKEREEKLQRETLEAEKEIIRLRNQKLKEEMTLKDKELANSTLDMIQKNKLFSRIKKDLNNIVQQSENPELIDRIAQLVKKINKELDTDKQWEVFESHFENVHEAFLKRIKTQYPDLSPRELKLCAYLRLNISSKEIAALMNISTRGVEISRYRLRKKLQLSRTENLTEFILAF